MFTKTSLNKIKKADLVQMYLDLQAKDYDEKMEQTLEKCCNNAIKEVVNGVEEVVEELKKENESQKIVIVNETIEKEKLQTEVVKLKKQIEDLQDERYKMCGIANANGWDIYPTDDEETDEESEEESEEEEEEGSENKVLKEKNESRQKIPDDVIGAFKSLAGSWWDDEARFYREHFDPEEDPELMGTDELEPCNYTDLRVISDFFNPN